MSDFDIAEMLHDANKFADDNNYVEAAEIYLKITNIAVSYTHLTLPTN